MSDLEQILSGEPQEQETPVVEATEPEPEAVEVEVKAEPEPKAPDEPQMVPVGVVQELRRELREMKAAQSQQTQKAAPDVFDDPEGFSKHLSEAVEARATGTKLEMSRFMAEREFGKDVVDAAYEYFDQHPEQSRDLLKHPSPFHAAVEHFNRQRVTAEIGNDPDAWIKAKEAEITKRIEAELAAKQARDAAGKFAPSMANVTGTGGGPKTNWTGPTSLSSVLGD